MSVPFNLGSGGTYMEETGEFVFCEGTCQHGEPCWLEDGHGGPCKCADEVIAASAAVAVTAAPDGDA